MNDEAAQTALLQAVTSCEVGQSFQLSRPFLIAAESRRAQSGKAKSVLKLTAGRVLSKSKASARLCFTGAASQHKSEEACSLECVLKLQDNSNEAAAMGVLRLLNASWSSANLHIQNHPIAAQTYAVEPIGSTASLVEVIPESKTLGYLKRNFAHGDVIYRVAEQLGSDSGRLGRLAASTAALLSSNYILGAAAGDGDNMLLTDDGTLFRIDFSHLFGSTPAVGGLLAFDSPVVWLPRAVTTALGEAWPEVREMARLAILVALSVCTPIPPAEHRLLAAWCHMQAYLFRVQRALNSPVMQYISNLKEREFSAALAAADSSLKKKIKTFLHDSFGYRSRVRLQADTANLHDESRKIAVEVDVWYGAVGVLLYLCRERVVRERVLESLASNHLVCKPTHSDVHAKVLHGLAIMSREGLQSAQRWLVEIACHKHQLIYIKCISEWLGQHGFVQMHGGQVCEGEVLSSTSNIGVSLYLGLALALARMVPPAFLTEDHASGKLQDTGSSLSSSQVEAQVNEIEILVGERFDNQDGVDSIQKVAATILFRILGSEDLVLPYSALSEIPKCLLEEQVVAVLQHMDTKVRSESLRVLERYARDDNFCQGAQEVRSWARRCLVIMALDENPIVSKPAMCTIACAVDDDNTELQQWAREFMKSALRQAEDDDENDCSPVFAFKWLARDNDACLHTEERVPADGDLFTS